MEIKYRNKKLERKLTDHKAMVKSFGLLARKISQRLKDLGSAENLAVMRTIPAAGCHELMADRKGELAVSISGNYRIIFQPNHAPVPRKDDGGLNWEQITSIQINDIEDYH